MTGTSRPTDWVRNLGLAVLLLIGILSRGLLAAEEKAEKKPPAGKVAEAEMPKPEDVILSTDDNVQIAITYYPGTKGKESVPVVLLHEYGTMHNRTDFTKDLAPYLQMQGFAVVAVDLRGHGESTRVKNPFGKDETLDAAALAPNQFGLMVTEDMKAVRKFLWEKNNAGELNLDKLCLVGSEMGAMIAVDFALYDALAQEANPVLRPEYKIGLFVKALVLISPATSFKGMSMRRALQNTAVRRNISVLIIAGKRDNAALGEARRVYSMFERDHPKPNPDKKLEQQTLFFTPLDTSLQGAKLLAEKSLETREIIAAFIELRLVKSDISKTWTWKERKLPHQ
jgi:pimeloyl-ACP methyl ester carboxylesterase